MDVNLYLLLALLATLLVIAYLLTRLHRVRGQLSLIKDALMDIKSGNLNRRVLVRESDMTKQICYDINEIAMSSQSRLIQQKQSEQAYKRLMTSLSHDVKTPLASLVGYLEAVESKMVTGAEQEEYIRVAAEKAHHLKEFVTVLFEWVKLDAGEQIFHFELCDLNELSRNIMADWVPLLESHDLTYEIEIPETEYMTRVDSTAYTRILNNLLQNILTHSVASQVSLTVTETEQQAKIVVADNGKGISASDLPHIFERMYQCDHSHASDCVSFHAVKGIYPAHWRNAALSDSRSHCPGLSYGNTPAGKRDGDLSPYFRSGRSYGRKPDARRFIQYFAACLCRFAALDRCYICRRIRSGSKKAILLKGKTYETIELFITRYSACFFSLCLPAGRSIFRRGSRPTGHYGRSNRIL